MKKILIVVPLIYFRGFKFNKNLSSVILHISVPMNNKINGKAYNYELFTKMYFEEKSIYHISIFKFKTR